MNKKISVLGLTHAFKMLECKDEDSELVNYAYIIFMMRIYK